MDKTCFQEISKTNGCCQDAKEENRYKDFQLSDKVVIGLCILNIMTCEIVFQNPFLIIVAILNATIKVICV